MRAAVRVFARDLRRLVASPAALLVTAGVCLLPSLYAWVNVLANWNPYESTSDVPVAVVVLDEGAEVPGLGRVNAGEMVRERLEADDRLGWEFPADEREALDGVRSGRYYAAFVIPSDFTSSLADVTEGDAQPASIGYYVNEKANAVAPKVTDTGATTLADQVSQEFVEVATRTVCERVQSAAGAAAAGAGDAAAGAERGLREAQGSLGRLAGAMDSARDGLSEGRDAVSSAREALEGARGAAGSLASTLDGALGGLDDARGQVRSLSAELSSSLGVGASALRGISSAASHDVGALAGDVGWAQGKVDAAIAQMRAANGTVSSLAESLARARDAVAAIPTDDAEAARAQRAAVEALDRQAHALAELADGQSGRLEDLQGLSDGISAGAGSLRGLADSVNDAVSSGADALSGLQADVASDVAPGLSAALDALAGTGGRAAAGAEALSPMVDQADSGLESLDGLLAQADSALADGASSLRDEAGRLGAAADALAAARGAVAVAGAEAAGVDPDAVAAQVAAPVEMASDPVYPVASYGAGVAPFYTNLALWVGGFVLVAIYKLEVDREGVAGLEPHEAFLGRWLLLALLGQVQAVLCCAGDVALGVRCVSPVAYVAAGMVASLVYVLVVYSLSVTLKHVGKGLAVLLVVLQIPGASGLYPIQMQPALFRALGPWLPFTYGIGAMREAMAGFYGMTYARDLALLACFAIPALVLGLGLRRRLLGMSALFDREMHASGLLVAEHVAEPGAGSRRDAVVDALLASDAHRARLLARAARLELAYPALGRRGRVALVASPLAALALVAVVPTAHKPAALLLWVAAVVAPCAFLVGLEYAHEGLVERPGLSALGKDGLERLARGEGGGDER